MQVYDCFAIARKSISESLRGAYGEHPAMCYVATASSKSLELSRRAKFDMRAHSRLSLPVSKACAICLWEDRALLDCAPNHFRKRTDG